MVASRSCDGLGQRPVVRVEEVRVAALTATPDPPPQLVELREAEGVRALDDQGVGVRDVQAVLDDRRADQDVVLALPELVDGALEPLLGHLPVRGGDPGLGHEPAELRGRVVDRGHPVVDVEDLAVAQQLAPDRGRDLLLVVGADVGQRRVPLLGRGEDRRELADAGEAHLQRARDRRRRHREHVDVRAQPGDVLLVLHAEALLLVDDDEPEVLPRHAGLQQPVGPDDDVDGPVGQPADRRVGLLARGEAGEPLHRHREVAHALGERLQVLLGQQRRRDEDRDLLAVLHRLERRPHRDLGLAVADVAGDDAVHRDRLLHVGLDLVDRRGLVRRLGVGERVLHLALPRGVRGERVPGRGLPGGVELHEARGDVADGLARLRLRLRPVRAAELVQRRAARHRRSG